jgi:hypothetical protein
VAQSWWYPILVVPNPGGSGVQGEGRIREQVSPILQLKDQQREEGVVRQQQETTNGEYLLVYFTVNTISYGQLPYTTLLTKPCSSFFAMYCTYSSQTFPSQRVTSHLSYHLHSLCKQKEHLASFHIVPYICYLHGWWYYLHLRHVDSKTAVLTILTTFEPFKGYSQPDSEVIL